MAHINRARRSGPQQGGHAQATPFRCAVMNAALQQESDLCLLPHTVPWPNQATVAGAPVAAPPAAPAPHIAPAPPGNSAATNASVSPLNSNLGTGDDEGEEMEEDEADDLDSSPPASVHSILVDKIVDVVYKTITIGCYYLDRIESLDYPDGKHDVISSNGHRTRVNLAKGQQNASMVLCDAIAALKTAADGLGDENLQQDQLVEFAETTCKAISQIPVALEWYSKVNYRAGNTEEDMEKLKMMEQAILDEFDIVEEDEDAMEEDGDDD